MDDVYLKLLLDSFTVSAANIDYVALLKQLKLLEEDMHKYGELLMIINKELMNFFNFKWDLNIVHVIINRDRINEAYPQVAENVRLLFELNKILPKPLDLSNLSLETLQVLKDDMYLVNVIPFDDLEYQKELFCEINRKYATYIAKIRFHNSCAIEMLEQIIKQKGG